MKKTYKKTNFQKMNAFQSIGDDIFNPDDNLYNRAENEEREHFYPKHMRKVKDEKISKNDEIVRYDEI